MLHIVSIVPYKIFPAKVGGQKGIALFNEYLAKETRLVCITVKSNDPAYAKGYPVLNLLSNAAYRYIHPLYVFTIRSTMRRYYATHLLLEHPYYGWLGILLKMFTGVRLVVHSHNIEATRWKSLGKWWWKILWGYEKMTHRMADCSFFIQDNDRQYAISQYGLKPSRCITVTYGIDWNRIPDKADIRKAREHLRQQLKIAPEDHLLLFNGAFDYRPNLDALHTIVHTIEPMLEGNKDFHYKIIICGRNIPDAFSTNHHPNIIFAGFVDDISLYFKGADVFINPVTDGGGIKTKLVEALGYNMNAVSTLSGAIGVDAADCNGKLLTCGDTDWPQFAQLVVNATAISADMPAAYFNRFYWGYSIKKAVTLMEGVRKL